MEGLEFLLVGAAAIIAVVFLLYIKERSVLKKYHSLMEERGEIEKLSKQMQFDYFKRKIDEATLKKTLDGYHQRVTEINQKIDKIEKGHGISRLEKHLAEKDAVPNQPINEEMVKEGVGEVLRDFENK